MAKGFTTEVTAVRLLSRVDTHVAFQTAVCYTTIATEVTAVRLLSRVDKHVAFQTAVCYTTIATEVTAVRFLSSVDHHVLLKAAGRGKVLPTGFTLMCLHNSGIFLFCLVSLGPVWCLVSGSLFLSG